MKNFNELVTIVIPIFNLVIDRYLNFKFILKKLNGLQIPIIIVEQKSEKTNQTVAQKLLISYPNILYKEVLINDNKIHKSKLVNIGNSLSNTKYLWMLDSDCYMKYMNVANRIINQPVIHPFNRGIYLTKHESDKFLSTDKLILTEQKRDHVVTDFGPLSFIIRRDIFNKIGGMNEEYTGYGWEDYEFANKLYEYPLEQFPITALHLYHTPCKIEDENPKNRELFIQSIISPNESTSNIISKNTTKSTTFSNLSLFKSVNPKNKIQIINKESSNKLLINNNLVKTQKNYQLNTYSEIKNIIHIISPALVKSKQNLYDRELLTLMSVMSAKNPNVTKILVGENLEDWSDSFILESHISTSKDLGDSRGLPKLNELFEIGIKHGNKNSIILYTNSDCIISQDLYDKLLLYQQPVIEYHRKNINLPIKKYSKEILNDIKKFNSSLHELGIDGLALSYEFFQRYKEYILDFYIGEPHWDTVTALWLRYNEFSILNVSDIYHPIHDKQWNLRNLSVPGQHNVKLYKDALEYDMIDAPTISLPKQYMEPNMSVILIHFGKDQQRINATTTALKYIQLQQLPVELIFVEMVFEDSQTGAFENNPIPSKYIKIIGKENNKNLWQKESMMNIGGKAASHNILMFIDADVYSKDYQWFDKVYNEVFYKSFVQGFRFCYDSSNMNRPMFISQIASIKSDMIVGDIPHNPGLCIACHKDHFKMNRGFNPFFLYGAGDSGILSEYTGLGGEFIYSFDQLNKIKRNTTIFNCTYIDCDIIHQNHGKLANMSFYRERHNILKKFTKPIHQLINIDNNGLLSWVNPKCVERKLIEDLQSSKFK